MSSRNSPPALELTLPAALIADDERAHDRSIARRIRDAAGTPADTSVEAVRIEVLAHFDRSAAALRRYAQSFGLTADAADDVVQDVFVSLFRHLRLGRPRHNLTAWLFRVTHNLSLRQRRTVRRDRTSALDDEVVGRLTDFSDNPEQRLANGQRRTRLRAVVRAMPERDRRCLHLRAEGLRYREIASTLGISLGSVAKSLTRALARLINADVR